MCVCIQDLDDWEDVGLNAAQPPDLLTLLRDYSHHVVDPVQMRGKEIEELKFTIEKLVHTFSTFLAKFYYANLL